MAILESYVVGTRSLGKFIEAIRSAGVPARVTVEFLKTLGFKSSNDRPIIAVLKGIGFLDPNGAPTELYRRFRDPAQGPRVLASALRDAYSDLFLAHVDIHDQPIEKIKGIVATKTSKGDRVVTEIARTFQSLAKAADFSEGNGEGQEDQAERIEASGDKESEARGDGQPQRSELPTKVTGFHYNIQIHLPTTTDITVYNAIFRSLKEHLF